ncbi:MAG: hypothetical protein RLZ12_56 [Bacillota bacterium]|jgi:cell division inhibitor SepF
MQKLLSFIGVVEEEELGPDFAATKGNNNIVALHTHKNIKMILCEPRHFEHAQEVADHLKGHRPVLINLQAITRENGVKVLDFLSGTVYAIGGTLQKVGPHIFVCAPPNVDIQGTVSDGILEGCVSSE